jgi:hypothetical protein
MFSRRTLIVASAAALVVGSVRARGAPARADALRSALDDSDLIYITPLKGDGSESRCHAEVWFAFDGTNVYVVTSSAAWRARNIRAGRTQARAWVGEFGNWQRANEAYRAAPELLATGSIVTDAAEQTRVLELLGDKYSLQWLVWGPRFRNGIADGSRVMLQYAPAG